LVGLFGTNQYGYDNYSGFSKPATIMMGYAWINPDISSSWNLFDTITYKILAKRGHDAFLYENPTKEDIETMNVANLITPNYPATFVMHGNIDHLVPHILNSDMLASKFQELNVPYEYYLVKNVNHGAGICEGTNGEDWLIRAIDFWQSQIS
jgi:acetyl esterase/lipase